MKNEEVVLGATKINKTHNQLLHLVAMFCNKCLGTKIHSEDFSFSVNGSAEFIFFIQFLNWWKVEAGDGAYNSSEC